MNALWIVVFALVGLFAAGAMWVIARNQAGRRFLLASPTCDAGTHELGLAGWLPLFCFGRAAACPMDAEPRSRRRIAFELAVAVYWGVATLLIDDWRQLIAVLVFTAPLLFILRVDSWTRLVHVNVIAAGIVLGLIFAGIGGTHDLLSSALGLVVGAATFVAFFVLAIVIYRNPKVVPFGLGDVYLAGMIGAMVTFDQVVRALVYGVFVGGLCVALLLAFKRVNRKQAIPYGPFLVVGALIALIS
jgi:leader peptidase (prepilin peptidase) / N-methyltransferase